MPKLVPGWEGDVGHMGAAAAVGTLAGYMVGTAIRSTADLTQLACAQAALTLFLINLGVVRIEWARVRALASCFVRLPLSILQVAFAHRAQERRRREAAKREGWLPADVGDEDHLHRGGCGWGIFNEHAAAGGSCGFVSGLCVGLGWVYGA